jgi:hypothetical protein
VRVQIVDDQELAKVSPRNARLYLRMHGWTRTPPSTSAPDVWAYASDDGTYEVVAPSSSEARDLPKRFAEMIRTLSVAENRSELEVLRDLATLAFDIQYVHAAYPGPAGTAPLMDAAAAFGAAQALLSASTSTLEEPRLVLPPRRSAQTADFMKKVLAGPTTEGSYVISIWVPVPPRLTQEEDAVLFDDPSEPFERRATRHLNHALVAAQAASREASSDPEVGLEAFVRRESDGLSANLCEALVALAGEAAVPFDVRFAWALERPVADLAPVIRFNVESIPVLSEAARELRARLPEDEVRIRGNVIRLHREGEVGGGEVTVAGVVTGDQLEKMRRVSVSLAESDYARAIEAHRSFADVEVVGWLTQRGTRTYLRDARAFDVRPSAEDSI